MSELLALSFDADASPGICFQEPRSQQAALVGPETLYGWGVGWYPNSEKGASVLKDPTSSGQGPVGDVLTDWRRFRSTLFLCHLRGHTRRRTQQDAQPFVRSYGGRQWIFAHDGDLAPDYAQRLALLDDPSFEPLGRTDSEHAFCWLLATLHAERGRALADVEPEELQRRFQEMNLGGQLNAILSDGDLLLVYRDAQGSGSLGWIRSIPPHPATHLESDAVAVDLNAPEDTNRTALVFSSLPLSQQPWLPMAGGQLVLARRGSVIWDSHLGQVQSSGDAGQRQQVVPSPRLEATHQLASAEPVSQGQFGSPPGAAAGQSTERILSVVHETLYHYAMPVERSAHRLLLRPHEDRHQDLLSFELELSPSGAVVEYDDVFGNVTHAVEIREPYTEFTIRSRARVRSRSAELLEQRLAHRSEQIPLVWMPWQSQMLSAYLLPGELPETQLQELSEFAMSFVERNDKDLTGTLLDMNRTLYRDFEYVSGSTNVATTPFEVFESRRGVCQDFANLMICLARLLNVPARYRMGYIFTGADYLNKVQSEASHAWVEVYVPRMGWHGLDPTNGRQVGSEHVRVACGRNYRDATPTSGTIYRGGGTETLSITVRVEDVSQGS